MLFSKLFESSFFKRVKNNRKLLEIIIAPLIASIIPIVSPTSPAKCAFVLLVMSFYWITECIPFAITSVLPVALYPLFGIMESKEISQIYFQDIIMLFFGGLVLATCVELCGLHKRIAFRVIMLFGSNPLWLLLGIMSVTGFLSLWISNLASASMMLPIVTAVVKQLIVLDKTFSIEMPKNPNAIHDQTTIEMSLSKKSESAQTDDNGISAEPSQNSREADLPNTKAAQNLMKGFCLSLTFAASIGGSGSLVGTAPNLILQGFYNKNYPDVGLNFFTFMLYALPTAIVMLFTTWLVISFLWLPKKYLSFSCCLKKKEKSSDSDQLQEYIRAEYKKLGSISWEEGSIGGMFLLLVLLWITRDIYFVPGWGALFRKGFVSDSTPAIFVVLLLAAWPKKNIFKGQSYENLVSWKDINQNFPWSIILLSGGGLALAEGFKKSQLSEWIGKGLQKILPKQEMLALFIILIFILAGTEFLSNTSMASVFIPIADSLSKANNLNPNSFLLPIALSTSYAFMLPVATPTNAIVYGTGHLKIKDMAITGVILKVIGITVLLISKYWEAVFFANPLLAKSTTLPTPLNSTQPF